MIAWAHAIGLQAMVGSGLLDAVVTAVHDPDEKRAAGLASANDAAVAGSVSEVLERCDAAWVCTPTACHGGAVERAVALGRAVFCEKPLTTDLAGAEALAAAVAGGGIPAQVGLVLRSAPVFRALRALVESGELGAPMSAVLRDDQYFPIQGLYASTWRGDVSTSGGGCLIEHSIHDVDILRFCLGEVVEVSARTRNFSGHEGVEDCANVSLGFASGATAELVSVWHSIMSRPSTRRLELFCERGLAWFDDDFVGPMHVQTSDGVEVRACPPPEWVEALPLGDDATGIALRMYAGPDRAFLDAVSEGRPPVPGFADAVVAHLLVDAAYRSAASGGVPINLA